MWGSFRPTGGKEGSSVSGVCGVGFASWSMYEHGGGAGVYLESCKAG